MVHVMCIRSGP